MTAFAWGATNLLGMKNVVFPNVASAKIKGSMQNYFFFVEKH